MRLPLLLSAAIALSACGSHSPQADALDNAAKQADPAAADVMRNEADQIRADGNDGTLADPNGAAQQAMGAAGAATANGTEPSSTPAFGTRELVTNGQMAATPARPGQDTRAAQPHKAGAPVPNTTEPTPVANHY
jgi:hypothetical protein